MLAAEACRDGGGVFPLSLSSLFPCSRMLSEIHKAVE